MCMYTWVCVCVCVRARANMCTDISLRNAHSQDLLFYICKNFVSVGVLAEVIVRYLRKAFGKNAFKVQLLANNIW